VARPLISRRTLTEFRDRMTGWVLREIDGVFAAAGIPLAASTDVDVKLGARCFRVELYYASLDLTTAKDVGKLLQVFESVLANTRRDFSTALHSLERDGYVHRDGHLRRSVADARIHDEVRRIEESVDGDPALAIGLSKKLIESVCETILQAKHVTFSKRAGLSGLLEATTKALKIAPDDIPSSGKGSDLIVRTLHDLASIAGNIGELQTLYGGGHGKGAKTKGLRPRHARLAAGTASALVNFLWETFEKT